MRRRTYQCVLYDDGGSLQVCELLHLKKITLQPSPVTHTRPWPLRQTKIKEPTQLLNEVLDAFTADQRAQQVRLLHTSALRCGAFEQSGFVFHLTFLKFPPFSHAASCGAYRRARRI
jgi:hypothetical protein